MDALAKIYEPQIRQRKLSEKRIEGDINAFSSSVSCDHHIVKLNIQISDSQESKL